MTLLVFAGCGGNEEEPIRRSPIGIVSAESQFGYDATVQRLDSVLQAAEPIGVVARIDHAANAARVDDSLRSTHVTLFGNPELGTPLMQHNPLAGLDLPQKMLVYETPDGRAMLVYNSVDYLARRHGLADVETLPKMESALQGLAEQVTGDSTSSPDTVAIEEGAGIVQRTSPHSVDETFRRLKSAVEANEALSIAAELDHAENAETVDLTLPPTKLLAFGNPRLGTPLLQDAPAMALDLPQKMLVYQTEDGTVHLAYNDPFYLAERHVATGHEQRLQALSDTLERLAEQAAGEE